MQDGFPMELFAGTPLEPMFKQSGKRWTCDDKIKFRANADIFDIEIIVGSTSGE